MATACYRCGTCCIAADISTIQKPAAVRCVHLADDFSCTIYENRPEVCRNYTPWELCDRIQHPDANVRVRRFLEAFGMEAYLEGPPGSQPKDFNKKEE